MFRPWLLGSAVDGGNDKPDVVRAVAAAFGADGDAGVGKGLSQSPRTASLITAPL